MDYTELGKTGLRVSVAGLGCGGPSRIGANTGKSGGESLRLIRAALHEGVNFIDTAEAYGTEELIGSAIRGFPRDEIVISTKKSIPAKPHPKDLEVAKSLDQSLKRLGTEYVDIYNLHAVTPEQYERRRNEIVPLLEEQRRLGKIRFIGVTEYFNRDPGHKMLRMALEDDCWDVIMLGFNLLNQTARETVFPLAKKKGIGTLIMFAVRRALSRRERLREVLDELARDGRLASADLEANDPLGFLGEGPMDDIVDAAYRFCRHEDGADVILTGTGEEEHLFANLRSICAPDFDLETRKRIREAFGRLEGLTCE